MCEFECETSKVHCSFATLPLSSTIATYVRMSKQVIQWFLIVSSSLLTIVNLNIYHVQIQLIMSFQINVYPTFYKIAAFEVHNI